MNKKIIQLSLFLLATSVLFVSMYLYKIENIKESLRSAFHSIGLTEANTIGDYAQNIAEDIHFIVTGETLERKSDNAGQWEDLDIKT